MIPPDSRRSYSFEDVVQTVEPMIQSQSAIQAHSQSRHVPNIAILGSGSNRGGLSLLMSPDGKERNVPLLA